MGAQTEKRFSIILEIIEKGLDRLQKVATDLSQLGTSGTKTASQLGVVSQATERLQSAAQQTSQGLNQAITQLDRVSTASTTSATAITESAKKADDYSAALEKSSGSADRFTASAHSMVLGLAAIGASMTAIAAVPVKVAADFEKVMSTIKGLKNPTETEFKALETKARELGAATRYSTSEVAKGMKELAASGQTVSDIMTSINSLLAVDTVGSINDLGRSAEIVTGIMHGFRMESSDVGKAIDILAATMTNTGAGLDDLGHGLTYVAPIASGLYKDFTDLATAMGLLHQAGIRGSMGGTALRGMLDTLFNPTKEEAELMAKLSERIGGAGLVLRNTKGEFVGFKSVIQQLEKASIDAVEALKLFGQRAGPGMAALIGRGSAAAEQLDSKLRASGGSALKIADIYEKNLKGAIENLSGSVDELMITIGQPFLDALSKIVFVARDWVNAFKDMYVATGPVGQVLTTVIGVVGLFVTALAGLAGAWLLVKAPVMLVISWIGSFIGTVGSLVGSLGTLAGSLGITTAAISMFFKAFGAAAVLTFTISQIIRLIEVVKEFVSTQDMLDKAAAKYENISKRFEAFKDTQVLGYREIAAMGEESLRKYASELEKALKYYTDKMNALRIVAEKKNIIGIPTDEAKAAQSEIDTLQGKYDDLMGALSATGERARMLGIDLTGTKDKMKEMGDGAVEAKQKMELTEEQMKKLQQELKQMGSAYDLARDRVSTYADVAITKLRAVATNERELAIGSLQIQQKKLQDTMQLLQQEFNAKISHLQKQKMSETQYNAEVKTAQQELTTSRLKALQDWEKNLTAAYANALQQEKSYTEQVKALKKELADAQMSTDDKLRELRRKLMSDDQAWYDRQKQATETLRAAQAALWSGTAEGAKKAEELAKKATTQFESLATEVKKGDQVIISEQQGVNAAMSGVAKAGDIIKQSLQAQISDAEKNKEQWKSFGETAKDQLEDIQKKIDDIVRSKIEPEVNFKPETSLVDDARERIKQPIIVPVRYVSEGESSGESSSYHTGGRVDGPGGYFGLKSNEIMAKLLRDEFVFSPKATRAWGPNLLNAMNKLKIRPEHLLGGAKLYAFHEGGPTSPQPGQVEATETLTWVIEAAGEQLKVQPLGNDSREALRRMSKELKKMGAVKVYGN